MGSCCSTQCTDSAFMHNVDRVNYTVWVNTDNSYSCMCNKPFALPKNHVQTLALSITVIDYMDQTTGPHYKYRRHPVMEINAKRPWFTVFVLMLMSK